MKRLLYRLAAGLSAALVPAAVWAQAYGQATYSTVEYSSGVIQVGPITLPNTGATWFILGVVTFVAITGAIYTFRWSRRFFVRTQQ